MIIGINPGQTILWTVIISDFSLTSIIKYLSTLTNWDRFLITKVLSISSCFSFIDIFQLHLSFLIVWPITAVWSSSMLISQCCDNCWWGVVYQFTTWHWVTGVAISGIEWQTEAINCTSHPTHCVTVKQKLTIIDCNLAAIIVKPCWTFILINYELLHLWSKLLQQYNFTIWFI